MPDIAAWKITQKDPGANLLSFDSNSNPLSLDDLSQSLPAGAYTTFRTFEHNKVLNLDAHLDRLEETSTLMKRPITLNREKLRQALREIIHNFNGTDARVRITIDLSNSIGEIYIALEPLQIPPESVYLNGVKATTRRLSRNNPKAKMTDFIKTASAERKNVEDHIYEIFMKDHEDNILEGLSSNFYGVKSGAIWTANSQILMGVTRKLVLEQVAQAGYKLVFSCVNHHDLAELQEAFLTSSSRAVVPVVEIDGISIGTGKPGPIARKLLEMYEKKIKSMIRMI